MLNLDSLKDKYKDSDKDKLIEELYEALKENEKLKKKLRKYENPHTPSSKRGFDKVQAEGLKVGRKEGRKSGHEGRTRQWEEPTCTIEVTADKNPKTGSKTIKETGEYEEFVITDFKIEKVVTLYRCYYYQDLITGDIFMARHPNMPDKGVFGKNVIAFANTLHFENRVPFEGVASIFTNTFEIPMSTPTALNICNRTAEKLEPKYDELNQELRTSMVVNADETGLNQNGISEWLWGFFTPHLAFFVFFPKRGGEIVQKVLGKDFKGILGCDGWGTYKVFSEDNGVLLQRCWAHLIREVKDVCKDKKDLDTAYIWIKNMFEKVKKARKLKSERSRKKKYDALVEELDQWCQVYSHYKELRDLVTKVRNGKNFWFTCVLHSEVEPTNNSAERGLRKFVVLQKIMGCLRSEQGKKTTQIMLSLIGTWKLQKLNPYQELRALL